MIASVHLAEIPPTSAPRVLFGGVGRREIPGLLYAERTVTAPLSKSLLPRPSLRRVALIAAWEDDAALDAFTAADPLAVHFADGWEVRLEPLRVYGSWAQMAGLPKREQPVADDEPLAALTLGRPRMKRMPSFLRASARAEGELAGAPALLAAIGLARPPRLFATFSLWRNLAGMREYATGPGGAHGAAISAQVANPFHHESAFIRFRPYASRGGWDGRDPLAEVA